MPQSPSRHSPLISCFPFPSSTFIYFSHSIFRQNDARLEELARRISDMEMSVQRELAQAVQALGTRVSSEASHSASALEESQRILQRQLDETQRRSQDAAARAQTEVRQVRRQEGVTYPSTSLQHADRSLLCSRLLFTRLLRRVWRRLRRWSVVWRN